jgi:DNA gyrase subunit B
VLKTAASGEKKDVQATLKIIIRYDKILKMLDHGKDRRVIDSLMHVEELTESSIKDPKGLEDMCEQMERHVRLHNLQITQVTHWLEEDKEHGSQKIHFKLTASGSERSCFIDYDFITTPEYKELLLLVSTFKVLGKFPVVVEISGSEETAENIFKLKDLIFEKGKKDISIQRYKGLGEMNPEQLWETTMNPANRTLLQVKIEDGIEADNIFSVLMGDQVEPRRDFIIENALNVAYLDI